MRWLLHGNLTPSVAEALRKRGDTIVEPKVESNELVELVKSARQQQLDIITTDPALAGAPFDHKLAFNRSIVFLQLQGADVEQDDALDRLFKRYKRLTPGRLYTITATRVKIRQLPST